MQTDALVELQRQLLVGAGLVTAVCGAWLLVLALVAVRHRRSPELAARTLRRLGAPQVLVRLLVLAIGVGVSGPAHAVTQPVDGQGDPTPTVRLARALDGLPSPALPAPGPPVQVQPATARTAVLPTSTPPPATAPSPSTPSGPSVPAAPMAPAGPDAPTETGARHTVRAGESLWAISAGHLPRAGDVAIDRAWRRLYAANRDVVGPDPDALAVGVRLDLSPLDRP